MTTAILDTNIFVQALISSSRSASARVLDAHYDSKFRLIYSVATLDELLDVLMLPQIHARHGLSDTEILDFVASLLISADRYPGESFVSPAVTHDLTDTKFLSLAIESAADYLVTNDHRHLLPLQQYQGTAIVTPTYFLDALS